MSITELWNKTEKSIKSFARGTKTHTDQEQWLQFDRYILLVCQKQ